MYTLEQFLERGENKSKFSKKEKEELFEELKKINSMIEGIVDFHNTLRGIAPLFSNGLLKELAVVIGGKENSLLLKLKQFKKNLELLQYANYNGVVYLDEVNLQFYVNGVIEHVDSLINDIIHTSIRELVLTPILPTMPV